MISEAGAARTLNFAMVAILGALALALGVYVLVDHLSAVREIYGRLSSEEKRHVSGLGSATVWLVLGVSIVLRELRRWLEKRRARVGAVTGTT